MKQEDAVTLATKAQRLTERLRDELMAFGKEPEHQANFMNHALLAQAFLFAELMYAIEHDHGHNTGSEIRNEWNKRVDSYLQKMREGTAEHVPFEG